MRRLVRNHVHRWRTLTDEDPEQRPHNDHHHEHHGSRQDGHVRDAQQARPQLLQALGLPPALPVLPANLLQRVVDGGHLHRHVCNLQEEEEEEEEILLHVVRVRAFIRLGWRRMKNDGNIRSSTQHSSSYRGNIHYSLSHPIRSSRLTHRFSQVDEGLN